MTGLAMKPSARRVLQALRRGPQTTHDLMQADVGGVRFGARLLELRTLGFVIFDERLPLPARGTRYTLTHDPEKSEKSFPSAASLHGGEVPTGVALPATHAGAGASGNRAATFEKEIPVDRHDGEGSLFDAGEYTQRPGYRDVEAA